MHRCTTAVAVALCALATLLPCTARAQSADAGGPRVDHHQHLLSPEGATLLNVPRRAPELPAEVTQLLRRQEAGWNDAAALAPLLTEDAVWTDGQLDSEGWTHGREASARALAQRFARPYRIVPVFWRAQADEAFLTALYTRGEGAERRNVGSATLRLLRAGGAWRIAMQSARFPGPELEAPLDADRLVQLLDAAGIRRAVVLSVGYWFQSPMYAVADPDAAAARENAWTAEQVALHPERLVAFCSVDPMRDAAVRIVEACARDARFRGLKLHFGSMQASLLDAAVVARIRAVFEAANRGGLAIVVHTRDGDAYGAAQARIFIEQLLPAAPDVDVQVAHLWGGGALSDAALAVFAEAVAAGRPGTRRLVFDVSDAAYGATTPEQAALIVRRMRQIGLDRLFYGSDAAYLGHPDPAASWAFLRKTLPLDEGEFARLRDNEAPYLAHPR